MATLEPNREALNGLAELLTYPSGDVLAAARRCRQLVGSRAARHLDAFAAGAERAGATALEEVYTTTFDLDPACAPYVGHHLFGDGPQRGLFLARLADVYRQDGFAGWSPGGEVPDHLAVVLRYLAATAAGAAREALLRDALLPALEKMLAVQGGAENPYTSVLAAVREEVR